MFVTLDKNVSFCYTLIYKHIILVIYKEKIMNQAELAQKLEDGDIAIGDEVWITDFRHNDINESPIRHIKPVRVVISDNGSLPKNKAVYYSSFHFREIGKTGKILAKIIAPYDNTGYRSRTGDSVHIFLTEDEADKKYAEQCRVVLQQIDAERVHMLARFQKMTDEVEARILSHEV
jgi:hypothetical protein